LIPCLVNGFGVQPTLELRGYPPMAFKDQREDDDDRSLPGSPLQVSSITPRFRIHADKHDWFDVAREE
jgi:hypothetical protein